MIDALVRRFLGSAGSGVLDFYLQHNLWINVLLFTYVVLVLFARRSYGPVAHQILADFVQKYGERLAKKSRGEIRALLLKWKIPWENGLRTGWFPFISSPQGLLLRVKSCKTFEKIYPIDALVETVFQQVSSRSQ